MTTKIPPTLLDSDSLALIRESNAVINGNFNINQRAVTGTVTLGAGVYGHDRWKAGASGCTYTFASANGVTTLTISAGSAGTPELSTVTVDAGLMRNADGNWTPNTALSMTGAFNAEL